MYNNIVFINYIIIMANINEKDVSETQQSIDNSSWCETEEEVKNCTVAKKVIAILAKTNKIKENIEILYNYFSNLFPISGNTITKLISFFDNTENQKIAQKIFSKLYIKVGDKNRAFINTFLINSQWKNDLTYFINYISECLKFYPYKIDFDYDDIKELTNWSNSQNKEYRFYTYKLNNKRGLITTKDSWEQYYLDHTYDKLEYRKNDIFCWIKKDEKWSYGEYIKFNWTWFEIIWTIPWIRDIPNLSDKNWNIIYTSSVWKVWLQKIDTENLQEKLQAEYDTITIKNGLILASKNLWWKKQNLEIFWKDYKKLIIYEDIENYSLIEWLDNTFRFKTDTWYCYYEINNNWEIKEISFLQDVKTILRPDDVQQVFKNLQEWRPVFIKYHWDSCYCISKKGDEIVYHHLGSKFSNIVLNNFWLDKKTFCCYDINWITYIFDKITKILYKSNEKYKPQKNITLDELKKDLEKIEGISI
jgi:hypothetical protein